MEDGDTSISVKCRIGVFNRAEDMHHPLTTDADYGLLKNYVGAIQDAEADHVVLHARPAVLAGISPVKNRIVPQLDYEFVERIVDDFPDIDITLNGGVTSLSQLESLLGAHQSVMAGRWSLRRPLDLVGVEALLKDRGRIEPKLVMVAVERYADYALYMASSIKQKCGGSHEGYTYVNDSFRAHFTTPGTLQTALLQQDGSWQSMLNVMSKGQMKTGMQFDFEKGKGWDELIDSNAIDLIKSIKSLEI